jgi:anaerobic ribonucleoside-triphosphate reductase
MAILKNGNVFLSDIAMKNGLIAIEILKKRMDGAIILGVEFEIDDDNVANATRPIVSCLLHDITGVHNYQVNVQDKTITVYK